MTFEFQGGEPFLNFPGLRHFVEQARRHNEGSGKQIAFNVVSNLMVATDEQLKYRPQNGVTLSYTLNGPQSIHDDYRIARNGAGSYERVMRRIREVQQSFPGLLSAAPLCVVTRENASQLREMIDFYQDAGFASLAIIALKNLGNAVRNRMTFDVHEFLTHYLAGLDYIYEKNRTSPVPYSERMVRVALAKIFARSDVGYVDWRNPCGDVSGALTYDYDGEILPSDEARSMRRVFGLGSVLRTTYDGLVRDKATYLSMNLSLEGPRAGVPRMPVEPVLRSQPGPRIRSQRRCYPRPHESQECLFTIALLDWTFEKLMSHPVPLMRMLPGFDQHAGEFLHDEVIDGRRPAEQESVVSSPDFAFPRKIQIQTHNRCNFACSMCPYEAAAHLVSRVQMDKDLLRKIIGEVAAENEHVELCLMLQNEPLLDRRFLDFLDDAHSGSQCGGLGVHCHERQYAHRGATRSAGRLRAVQVDHLGQRDGAFPLPQRARQGPVGSPGGPAHRLARTA